MKKFFSTINIIYLLAFCLIANSFTLICKAPLIIIAEVLVFLFIIAFAGFFVVKGARFRLKICHHGGVLLCVFMFSALISLIYHIFLAFELLPNQYMQFIYSALVCICLHALVFWNGIICVYCTSVQLGIKLRVVGALCGFIPIVNLVVLKRIISASMDEVYFETEKEKINLERKDKQICKTAYPILLVHGVFFRDFRFFNYWGRIPKQLEENGAAVYYGNHQSAASVADSAKELKERIEEIIKETGCQKVNIIAHSKGGLDCRYAISELKMAPYVASLTTVNTPHRGCLFADYLLEKIPEGVKNKVASAYNGALKRLGDKNPDFLAAVNDLTAQACIERDKQMGRPDGVFCHSIGSVLNKAASGKFPLNFCYHLVKFFDGANDGLVSEKSFEWGERYTLVTVKGKRGVSHGDMIDLNRENIKDFDVREFYVKLVCDLKARGL
ncbi:MAG: triacylglycerol lipase [Ruminococcaceae bacterium]|nr:triacylglycerol lipase [Oscillospiraceae bacterium]